MQKQIEKYRTVKILILSFFNFLFFAYPFLSYAGSIDPVKKFAWSDNIGYVNFGDVVVDDSSLSGYAWSANMGFINLSPSPGGVSNDGQGSLSGYAWGEQLGWLDFSGVEIDEDGRFLGTATGELVGTLTFDCPTYCDVETDWRRSVSPPAPTPTPSPSPSPSGSGGGSHSSSGGGTRIFPDDLVESIQEKVSNFFDFPKNFFAGERNISTPARTSPIAVAENSLLAAISEPVDLEAVPEKIPLIAEEQKVSRLFPIFLILILILLIFMFARDRRKPKSQFIKK